MRWAAVVAAAAGGCKGGDRADGDDDDAPPVILSTVEGEADDVDMDLVSNTCDDDLLDDLEDFELRMSQVATGLSVFVPGDLGWVPCSGSVQSFDCQWGEAANNRGTWTWRLWGTASGAQLDATLSLTVRCDTTDDDRCEECQAVVEVRGELSR